MQNSLNPLESKHNGGFLLTEYEKLLENANENNVSVYDHYDLTGTRLKGLYCDGTVAISKELETDAERTCVLAEELGHHYTSYGNIIDTNDTGNRKQELRARIWAYNKQIGLSGIIRAYKARCMNKADMAEFLGVTEQFLTDALECYRRKYGVYVPVDNYIVGFEPRLYVIERITI